MVALLTPTQIHEYVTLGVELDNRVSRFIYDPKIIILIKPDLVSIGDTVYTLTNFSEKAAGTIELQKLGSRIRPDRPSICAPRMI